MVCGGALLHNFPDTLNRHAAVQQVATFGNITEVPKVVKQVMGEPGKQRNSLKRQSRKYLIQQPLSEVSRQSPPKSNRASPKAIMNQ
jgi:hypothetical protein